MAFTEDLIDFPVSDTFRGYFYERGLTPPPPADMGDYNARAMRDEIQALRREIAELVAQSLEPPVRVSQSEYRPATAPAQSTNAKPLPPARRPIWNGNNDT